MEDTDLVGVGDHAALDLVNSTAEQGGQRFELLRDGRSYLRWLRLAHLIDEADISEINRRYSKTGLDAAAADAVRLREWLRPVIAEWAGAGFGSVPSEVRSRLNKILGVDSRFSHLADDGRVLDRRRWTEPGQLLVPPAAAAAMLLSQGDPALVRQCDGDGCPLWFYDRTKAHSRRWCSMAWCGNRSKARNHRSRNA
jgi:predicted RNA-binding Zn ribbon-like protein